LGEGITLKNDTWQKLYVLIYDFHENGYFTKYGKYGTENYVKEITIDEHHSIVTGTFEAMHKHFFCINIVDKNRRLIWKGRYSRVAIMVLFNTISDFLTKCREYKIVQHRENATKKEKQIDKETGREIF